MLFRSLHDYAGHENRPLYDALARELGTKAVNYPDGVLEPVHGRMRKIINAGDAFLTRLATALSRVQPLYPEPLEIEQQLYSGGFVSRPDATLAERMADMEPEQVARHAPLLSDPRLREHALRWAFAADPTILPLAERRRLVALVQARCLGPADRPWRTVASARQELLSLKLESPSRFDLEQMMHLDRIALWLHQLEERVLRSGAMGGGVTGSTVMGSLALPSSTDDPSSDDPAIERPASDDPATT